MHTWEKMSLLENEEQPDRTDWPDSGGGPIPLMFGMGKDATGPSANLSVDRILEMIRRGTPGVRLLRSQLLAGMLPFKPEEMSSGEILNILMAVLKHSNPNTRLPYQPRDYASMELFELLVLGKNPRIDLGYLSPEDSDTLANELLEQGLIGIKCLADLVTDNRLPNFSPGKWSEQDLVTLLNGLINSSSDGMDLLKYLIGKDKLPNLGVLNVPEEFVSFCFSQGPSGIALLQVLMVKGKISNLDPSKFSQEEAKAFADKLSKYGPLGNDFLAELVAQRKFPPLNSESWYGVCARRMSMILKKTCGKIWQMTVNVGHVTLEGAHKVWQTAVKMGHMALEGIRGFWQTKNETVEQTDRILEETRRIWKTTVSTVTGQLGRTNITPKIAHRIWQKMANKVAADCFDAAGHVDVKRIEVWMNFFGNPENFTEEPSRSIPCIEFMRSQIHRVFNCLASNRNSVRDRLDAAASITVGLHGQDILKNMSSPGEPPLNPAIAILASLSTPNRQFSLPTCTIVSLINEEIQNHPERLIEIYMQMLESDQISFLSGCVVQQQRIENGFMTIDLKNGGKGKEIVFEDTTGGDSVKAAEQMAMWQLEGIEYTPSTNPAEKYKLKMPIRNMNDVLFAHLFQASNFGNRKIDHVTEYGTSLIYFGHRDQNEEPNKTFSLSISSENSNFLSVMPTMMTLKILAKAFSLSIPMTGSDSPNIVEELKKQAALKEQSADPKQPRYNCMRVAMHIPEGGHSENLDVDAILALDLDTMEPGKAYAIGDCNWSCPVPSTDESDRVPLQFSMLQDIPRLAVRKVDGTPPAYEFGFLYGSTFKKEDVSYFRIYTTDVEKHDAQYWEQFRP
jgi:hypothetical protein